MVKKNHEAEPVLRLSEESDSDSSSSSSEEEGLPPAPSQPTADKESADAKTMGSGSESDDFERPLKSILSKPMDDASKLKRPRSRPNSKPNLAASSMKTPTKRPTAAAGEKDSKKSKMEKGKGAWGGEEEEKKSVLFQRLWSDDDEVAILEGMIDYKEKKGVDPMADANDFHDFIKNSVHINVDRRQVVDKVRRLKKRYKNSSLKKKVSNPHEKEIIELSKKIWGQKMESADLDQQNKGNMNTRTISKDAATTNSAQNEETESPARNRSSATTYHGKKEVGNSGEGEKVGNSVRFLGKASVSMGLGVSIVNAGLELCGEDRKAEIEEKWRKLHLEESDLFLRKLDLARQESEMITAALRSVGK